MSCPGSLGGKRVLFVAPRFFGYDADITAELQRRGALVTRLVDRPFASPLLVGATKIAPQVAALYAERQYRKIIENIGGAVDLVLVLNGQTLSPTLLDEVRRDNPTARFVLYLWDSIENRPSAVPKLRRFDAAFSFDAADARRYHLAYRPLFFAPTFDRVDDLELQYDISFVGTAHSDRAPLLHALDKTLPTSVRRHWYLYLQAPWVYRLYRMKQSGFRDVPRHLFHFEPLPKTEIGRIFQQSRSILDIEHPLQRGLTMRTIEALGAGKKLVTTNRHIVDADFYDPRNIMVLDRAQPGLGDADFLTSNYVPIAAALRSRYSLAGWLDEVLGLDAGLPASA